MDSLHSHYPQLPRAMLTEVINHMHNHVMVNWLSSGIHATGVRVWLIWTIKNVIKCKVFLSVSPVLLAAMERSLTAVCLFSFEQSSNGRLIGQTHSAIHFIGSDSSMVRLFLVVPEVCIGCVTVLLHTLHARPCGTCMYQC